MSYPQPRTQGDALRGRQLHLAAMLIEAARHRPGGSFEQLADDACRYGARFGPDHARPDPAEFTAISGLTLAQLTAGLPDDTKPAMRHVSMGVSDWQAIR